MHLTLRSNNAMRLMMYCALNGGRISPVGAIARACNMSEAHLAKIANLLAEHGFVETVRGRGGGVRLARRPEDINVGAVVRCTETGACLTECLNPATNTCPLTDECRFRAVVERAFGAFLGVLDAYTLADLVADGERLAERMGVGRRDDAAA